MMQPYFALAIALLRVRERGGLICDEDVFDECAAQGLDPGPVMILVQGRAPVLAHAHYDLPDGTTAHMRVRGDHYVPITLGGVFTNTPDMTEARALRLGALTMEV